MARLELATFRLEAGRSIQLSHIGNLYEGNLLKK